MKFPPAIGSLLRFAGVTTCAALIVAVGQVPFAGLDLAARQEVLAQSGQRKPRSTKTRAASGANAANNAPDSQPANETGDATEPPQVQLPSDPRLLALHRDFVTKAERLAGEYESARNDAQAREVYQEILKLVPNYPPAQKKLEELLERELSGNRRVLDVQADAGWQPTGVLLQAGDRVRIRAEGEWTFRIVRKLSADGMTIPEELRDFNLGALVGMIAGEKPEENKPFLIGSEFQFEADRAGQLVLRMYDSDNSDNQGRMNVEISGTFSKR